MGENIFRMLVGMHEERRKRGRQGVRLAIILKWIWKELPWRESTDYMAQNKRKRQDLVNTAMNIRVP